MRMLCSILSILTMAHTQDDVKESEMTPYQPSDEDDLKRLKKELLSLNDMIPTEHVTEEFGSFKTNQAWKRRVRSTPRTSAIYASR